MISGEVSERVVDQLEAIQVEEDDCIPKSRRIVGVDDRRAETLEEQLAVGKSRDLVVERALAELLLELLARLDVVQ